MPQEKLYNYGLVIADIGGETESECADRILPVIKSLKDVFNAVRIPHMMAMDQVGEITFDVYAEQSADLVQMESAIKAIPGVKYVDLTPDLVRFDP